MSIRKPMVRQNERHIVGKMKICLAVVSSTRTASFNRGPTSRLTIFENFLSPNDQYRILKPFTKSYQASLSPPRTRQARRSIAGSRKGRSSSSVRDSRWFWASASRAVISCSILGPTPSTWLRGLSAIGFLYAILNSYLGIFSHARTQGLIAALFKRFGTLQVLFMRYRYRVVKRWEIPFRPATLATQHRFFRRRFRGIIVLQIGCFLEMFNGDAVWAEGKLGLQRIQPRPGFYARCGVHKRVAGILMDQSAGEDFLLVSQSEHRHGNVARRHPRLLHFALRNSQPLLPGVECGFTIPGC
jgi:hypothetical protein